MRIEEAYPAPNFRRRPSSINISGMGEPYPHEQEVRSVIMEGLSTRSATWCCDPIRASFSKMIQSKAIQTVEDWLSQLGLGKYREAFVKNDVDLRALPHVTEADLQELGVSLGHRKIILAAINELGQPRRDGFPPSSIHAEKSVPLDEAQREQAADRRLLSVLFCDLVGSTALSARLDPEDMHELIRRYQDSVAGAVTRFGGYVAKYLGDGVLAYFGWPKAYEDHAERAIRAALEALAAVEDSRSPDDQPLKARIGIASGHVVVGDIDGSSANERGSIAGETPILLPGCKPLPRRARSWLPTARGG